ncbi:MAG: hypothetical protein HYV09_06320 [Deltaproteobacteria bacterium]|nr:hypothetical protein [Deltaproteobacteria bacterium]
MHRSLQIQVLSWLAALATLGAATRPTFDTILFATAFVFGTLLMHVRERLEPKGAPSGRAIGRVLGVVFAWGAVALRHFSSLGAKFPPRLSTAMLIAAAVIPTGIALIEGTLALLSRRARARAAERAPTDS